MRWFCILFLLLGARHARAQLPCTKEYILGTWWECGAIRSPTYDVPLRLAIVDSLKQAFPGYDEPILRSWTFGADGRYHLEYSPANVTSSGRYWVVPEKCALKFSFRRRDPVRILHLDDSFMILWYRNPKTAYLTVYRRHADAAAEQQ